MALTAFQYKYSFSLALLLSLLANGLIFSMHVLAQDTPPSEEELLAGVTPARYVCYRTGEPLQIDGKPDEEVWQKAEWTNFFVDIEGDLKPAPRFRTRARMLWDETYFYIAAELEEPHIWAYLTQRDTVIFYDNDFEVFIDPDGDTQAYYEYEVNARETVWDLMLVKPYIEGGPPINAWDISGLKTATYVDGTLNDPSDTDRKWTIEIALPWSILKEAAPEGKAPEDGDQWRINFSRVEWQTDVVEGKYLKRINPATGKRLPEDNWVWSPQGVVNMHRPEQWGYVQFSGLTVGTETVQFSDRSIETLRRRLYRLYYRQRAYRAQHGKYATDLNELSIDDIKFGKTPVMEATPNQYAITAIDSGGRKVHLRHDGRSWIE